MQNAIAISILCLAMLIGVGMGYSIKKTPEPQTIVKEYNDTALKNRIELIECIIGSTGLLDNVDGISKEYKYDCGSSINR